LSDPAARLRQDMAALAAADPGIAAIVEAHGLPDPPFRPTGFPTLLRAIVAQQVSAAAARTVFARFETAAGGPPTATHVLGLGYDGVRALGLSGRKTDYALGLAESVETGALDVDGLAGMDDEAVIESLTALKGIGRWTAEVYLLFALARPDVWPAADLALTTAAGRVRGLPDRPSFKDAAAIADVWRPRRSAAAVLLWHLYRTAPQ